MGAALSARGIVTVITALSGLVMAVGRLVNELRADAAAGNIRDNPVLQELEERIRQEQGRAQTAEQRARQAEEMLQRMEASLVQATERQRQEDEARQRAEEGIRRDIDDRMRAEAQSQAATESVRATEQEVRRIEERARRAAEERVRAEAVQRAELASARRADAERKRADDAKTAADQQRRLAEEERRKAEDQRAVAEAQRRLAQDHGQRAKAERDRADAEARSARLEREQAEQARMEADRQATEATSALDEAQRQLREGVRPITIPTREEMEATKRRLQYKEGIFHFAVAGVSGSGKSSLINAFRGLRNRDHGAAPTGIVETTGEITRYPDPDPANPWAWYDVPGAGTIRIPDWVYFNAQGLYCFDCIILLFDNRFTETDIAILRNCARYNIPAYIVRSKSNQHIKNILYDMGYDSDRDETTGHALAQAARRRYIAETRASVARNLREAQLPQQRVYVVSKDTLVRIIRDGSANDPLDELELLRDLLTEARARRSRRPSLDINGYVGGRPDSSSLPASSSVF